MTSTICKRALRLWLIKRLSEGTSHIVWLSEGILGNDGLTGNLALMRGCVFLVTCRCPSNEVTQHSPTGGSVPVTYPLYIMPAWLSTRYLQKVPNRPRYWNGIVSGANTIHCGAQTHQSDLMYIKVFTV